MADSDNLYSKILKELYSPAWLRRSGRDSYVELAKKLGIDDQTVRRIIGQMQKSGFLKAWSISLNPHILGMNCASVVIGSNKSSSSKDKIVSQLKLVEGVVAIFSFLEDPGFRVVLFYEDDEDLERRIHLISSICGAKEPAASWKIPFPPSRAKLKKTDWQIINFLLEDSRKNASEIAVGVGVSTRTVRRRLEVMTEGASFFISPIVDVKKVEGFLYQFVISFDSKTIKLSVDKSLHSSIKRIVFADTTAEFITVVATICENISAARQISDRLKTTAGVKDVTASIFEEIIFVREWLDHEIEKHLRA
jgi:DNA-binding Lrp family transcriptional regulator